MAEEKRNLETIPAGSLGIISLAGCKTLGEQVDHYLVNGVRKEKVSTKTALHFPAISAILISCKARCRVLEPAKERVSFWSLYVVWTFIFL